MCNSRRCRWMLELPHTQWFFFMLGPTFQMFLGAVHMGLKSQVTWGQSMQSQPLGGWKLGFTSSHGVSSLKSQLWHGCLHDDTFWRWDLGLGMQVGSSKKLDPTLIPSLVSIIAWNNQDLTLMILNHILVIAWGLQVGTLSPCWDLLTWVGTRDPVWAGL